MTGPMKTEAEKTDIAGPRPTGSLLNISSVLQTEERRNAPDICDDSPAVRQRRRCERPGDEARDEDCLNVGGEGWAELEDHVDEHGRDKDGATAEHLGEGGLPESRFSMRCKKG